MKVSVHGKMFVGQYVTYLWDFGDGKKIKTDWPSQRHNYTADKIYNLSVTAKSWARGQYYYGSTSAIMRFEGVYL